MEAPNQQPVYKDDDFEEPKQSVAEASESYSQYMNADIRAKRPEHPKRKRRKLLLALLSLAVLVLIVAAVYSLMSKDNHTKSEAKKSSNTTTQSASSKELSGTTKEYTANNFSLTLNYPGSWEVSEPAGSGKLTITSPKAPLKSANGQSKDGKIVITIRAKGQPLSGFDKGNATAARDSEMLTYTRPTPSQRASTYLSFLTYAGNNQGDLDALYITGDYGYKADQAVPAADLTPADPLISVTFLQCKDETCSSTAPLSVDPSVWNSDAIAKPIKDTLQSLAVE
jgi:hypothetical protein